MNKKIFINYRKEDSPWNSVALYQELIKHFPKGNVFKDFNTLRPGEDFVESIEKALASCDVLLVLISDKWLSIEDSKGNKRINNLDDFVRLEIATALKRNICVIPVLFDDASIPPESELPDDLKKLSRRHFIEIDKTRFEADTERLVEAIKASFKSDKSKISPLLKYVLFGIAVLVGVFLLYKFLGEKGSRTKEEINNQNINADTIPTGIQHTEQPGNYNQVERINVSATANPYSIMAGGQTELRVLTLTETDIPITNASVKIQAGGGWFKNSGNYIEVGKTNENGVFTTTWKSPDPAASGYRMNITVNKDGFLNGGSDLTINIRGPSTVNEPAPLKRINVSATANPYSISAGGQTEIRILALADDDLPIPNANVKIQAGGGWFNISGNYIEVGKTNENGVFTTTWKSPDPAAKGYGLNITINKEGFLKGERDLTININEIAGTDKQINVTDKQSTMKVNSQMIKSLLKKINVSFSANPMTIPAGGETELRVTALTDENVPIPSANIKIQSGGGRFRFSGTTTETGTTNANGVFITTWKCPSPAARGYGMGVTVSKEMFIEEKAEIMININ